MAIFTLSSNILLSYTIPLCCLLTLYILYAIIHVCLILDNPVYVLFLILHYVPALVYVVHRIAVHFSIKNILVTTVSFVLFPVHFVLTLYYKIMFSLMIIKINKPGGQETASLLNKMEPDQPLNTFIIAFTCMQVPLEFIFQICIYLSQRRHSTSTAVLVLLNLAVCLLLFTNGVVRYFRFETQNIHKYLLSHMRVKDPEVQAKRTYKRNEGSSGQKGMSQFQVDTNCDQTVVVDSHSLVFKVVVFFKWLLHNYIRLVSVGLVLFFYPTFTIIFFAVQTIVAFICLLFLSLKTVRKANIAYNVMQSILLNFCLIEYKIQLSNRKLVFVTYFLLVFAENLLFNYLWYFTTSWSRRYRDLFNATLFSLIVCQLVHFFLMFVYFVFYKPRTYEINYDGDADDEDEGNDTNVSDNEEEFRDIDNRNGFASNQRYENVQEESGRTNTGSASRNNVDRIRTTISTDTTQQKEQQKQPTSKVAFDNLIYTETEKQRPNSKYKELINDSDERIVYPKPEKNEIKRRNLLSPTAGVTPDQRESWKYVVEEIDDQIHKSTSNLAKNKLHLSSDRLNRKLSKSTDSLNSETTRTSRLGQSASRTLQLPPSLLETSHTKTYKHTKVTPSEGTGLAATTPSGSCFSQTREVVEELQDVEDEEEIVMENKFVDRGNLESRRTSRYSSQEFVEKRRDERVFEERIMNVKKMNTSSLV